MKPEHKKELMDLFKVVVVLLCLGLMIIHFTLALDAYTEAKLIIDCVPDVVCGVRG